MHIRYPETSLSSCIRAGCGRTGGFMLISAAAEGIMTRALIIARDDEILTELPKSMMWQGTESTLVSPDEAIEATVSTRPDVILYEPDDQQPEILDIVRRLKKSENLPVIALLPKEFFDRTDLITDADDFIAAPYEIKELLIRINRLVRKPARDVSNEQIECDGLIIDLATCEVTIDGRLIELTFKEYELLKLMAANKGRVFTREALLDKIWGYDYYGGDRTVDVHIRRLRSKIEDAEHIYIETVRNIGYRFIKS